MSSTEKIYARLEEIEEEKKKILVSRSITSEEFVLANTKYNDLQRERVYLRSIIEARMNKEQNGKTYLRVIK